MKTVGVYTEVGGPCDLQPSLFTGVLCCCATFGNDAILALVLIKRWSWKNLRKKRKFFQDSLGGFVNSPYLCSGK